ncbi:MAG: glycosyltransferase family 2 protein, partial [Caldibacillus sp.]
MSDPFVTVFMPVYNSGKYLVEAIESILRQTYRNLELLIVDDGSTDHSIEIIKTFADPRIRLIKNDQNRGIPFTRNVGLKEARGKYLAIMDSDDISHPERIERQVAYLENHPAIDVAGTFYVQFSENRKKKVAVPFT